MILKKLKLENYTVFADQQIEFSPGVNVLIGENGTGKTHLLKALYSACQSVDPKVSFPHKLVSTMLPDDYKLSRLISRRRRDRVAVLRVTAGMDDMSQDRTLTIYIDDSTRKWDAKVVGETGWENSFHATSSVFIPAKEILSNGYNLNAATEKNNVRFDDTYLDILNAAKVDVSEDDGSAERAVMLKRIQEMTRGTVVYDAKRDEFYLKSGNARQEFNLVAEGIRKMALLWQLVKNGALKSGSLLFWDEPEANINPAYIPIVVDMMLELQRQGVQCFVSTHDYLIAAYFGVKAEPQDRVLFHALSRQEDGSVGYERSERFAELKHNAIVTAFNRLLDELYEL